MPSLRARLLNALLRLTIKRSWHPHLRIEDIRRRVATNDARYARRAPQCPVEPVSIANLSGHWFGEPELGRRHGTMLYFHGGAWCLHLPTVYAAWAATLSRATNLRVLLVEYRLAPEHPFPAGVEDCFGVYQALLEGGQTPNVVAGDSAGGSLALVTLQRARDAALPLPKCAVLLSPSTDLTYRSPSVRYNADEDPMFSASATDLLPDLYCPGLSRDHAWLSPLFGAWHGLPPLYFLAGSTEILLDDSVRAYDRALQAGVDAHIDVWPRMPHVFPLFGMLPESNDAVGRIAKFIAQHLSRPRALPTVPASIASASVSSSVEGSAIQPLTGISGPES
jgi:acetyl esterase/lipase